MTTLSPYAPHWRRLEFRDEHRDRLGLAAHGHRVPADNPAGSSDADRRGRSGRPRVGAGPEACRLLRAGTDRLPGRPSRQAGGSSTPGPGDPRRPAIGGNHAAVEVVVLAIPGLPWTKVRDMATAASRVGASVRHLPSFVALLQRDVVGTDLRDLQVGPLIGRNEMHVVSPGVLALS